MSGYVLKTIENLVKTNVYDKTSLAATEKILKPLIEAEKQKLKHKGL
jgi:hypothetical protein